MMPELEKVGISDKVDREMRTAVIKHHYGVHESKFILPVSAETSVPSSAKISCVNRHNLFFQKME